MGENGLSTKVKNGNFLSESHNTSQRIKSSINWSYSTPFRKIHNKNGSQFIIISTNAHARRVLLSTEDQLDGTVVVYQWRVKPTSLSIPVQTTNNSKELC